VRGERNELEEFACGLGGRRSPADCAWLSRTGRYRLGPSAGNTGRWASAADGQFRNAAGAAAVRSS